MMKTYVCPKCDAKRHFKGLCRDCTEYDDNGNVVNPVRMEREGKHIHDENSGHLDEDNKIRITLEDFRNRRRPKLSKRQREKYQKMIDDAQFVGDIDEMREFLNNEVSEEE